MANKYRKYAVLWKVFRNRGEKLSEQDAKVLEDFSKLKKTQENEAEESVDAEEIVDAHVVLGGSPANERGHRGQPFQTDSFERRSRGPTLPQEAPCLEEPQPCGAA